MTDKLIVQKLVSADRGEERVTMFECRVTGDLIIHFGGGSYTLRAKAGEMAALLLELSVKASAAAGGVIDVD